MPWKVTVSFHISLQWDLVMSSNQVTLLKYIQDHVPLYYQLFVKITYHFQGYISQHDSYQRTNSSIFSISKYRKQLFYFLRQVAIILLNLFIKGISIQKTNTERIWILCTNASFFCLIPPDRTSSSNICIAIIIYTEITYDIN